MGQVTVEYMIMIPVLIAQIFIFPYTAAVIMDTWTDSRLTIELQEITEHLGSTIQQLYFTINHASISDGAMSINLDLPPLIENHVYTATLSHVPNSDGSYQIMKVTLTLSGRGSTASSIVTLGNNVDWTDNLSFESNAVNLTLIANKTANSIWLYYGGS